MAGISSRRLVRNPYLWRAYEQENIIKLYLTKKNYIGAVKLINWSFKIHNKDLGDTAEISSFHWCSIN